MSVSKTDNRLKIIGQKLKELRIEKGYTSHDFFAWDNKISATQYYRIERGQNTTLKSLIRILDIHGLTLEEFFEGIK